MLIRAEDESVYNLHHIERFEIVTVAIEDEISRVAEEAAEASAEASKRAGASVEAYVLRAYISGKGHDLVGPSSDRLDAESGLNRIYNMVSERADLCR